MLVKTGKTQRKCKHYFSMPFVFLTTNATPIDSEYRFILSSYPVPGPY